jgi:hypothetical protein
MGVICSECLLGWDERGIPWANQAVHAVTIVDGRSLCVKHFRLRIINASQEATV